MALKVLTVATDPEPAERLRGSCHEAGLSFELLGGGEDWAGFCMKYRLVRDHLVKHFAPTDVVIFSDGYDTMCQVTAEEVRQAYMRLAPGDRVVVSAEMYLWPPGTSDARPFYDNAAPYDDAPTHVPPPPRYPCSGQWAATARSAVAFIDRIYRNDDEDDQELLIRDLLQNPELYLLDYGCELFQANLYHLTDHDHGTHPTPERATHPRLNNRLAALRDADGRIRVGNLSTGSVPCFLHSNGTGGEMLDQWKRDYAFPLLGAGENIALPVAYQLGEPHEAFERTHRWPLRLAKGAEEALRSHLQEEASGPVVLLVGPLAASNEVCGIPPAAAVRRYLLALAASDYDVLLLGRCNDDCAAVRHAALGRKDLVEPAFVGEAVAVALRGASACQSLLEGLLEGAALGAALERCRSDGILAFVASNPPVLRRVPGPQSRPTCRGYSGTAVPPEEVAAYSPQPAQSKACFVACALVLLILCLLFWATLRVCPSPIFRRL
jgi:hypothetical protein